MKAVFEPVTKAGTHLCFLSDDVPELRGLHDDETETTHQRGKVARLEVAAGFQVAVAGFQTGNRVLQAAGVVKGRFQIGDHVVLLVVELVAEIAVHLGR